MVVPAHDSDVDGEIGEIVGGGQGSHDISAIHPGLVNIEFDMKLNVRHVSEE